jgi:hypothetical protein
LELKTVYCLNAQYHHIYPKRIGLVGIAVTGAAMGIMSIEIGNVITASAKASSITGK